jgi:FtsZ-binding cell division protein ZapB
MTMPVLEKLEAKCMELLEKNRSLQKELIFAKQQVDALKGKQQHANKKVGHILQQLELMQEVS